MSLNQKEFLLIIEELQKLIVPSRIEKISEIENHLFIFKLYSQEKVNLLISLKPKDLRLHLTLFKNKAKDSPIAFVSFLRKYIQDGKIINIELLNKDRIVKFEIFKEKEVFYLIFEFFEKQMNALVLNSGYEVIYHLNPLREDLKLSEPYQLPDASNFQIKHMIPEDPKLLYNQVIDNYFEKNKNEQDFLLKKNDLQSFLKKESKNSTKVVANLSRQLEECSNWNEWLEKGELLKAHMHLIKKGMESITLSNYFQDPITELEISLNPTKDPITNIEQYFKKSKKLKNGVQYVSEKLKPAIEQKEKIEELFKEFQNIENKTDFEEFIDKYNISPIIKRFLNKKENKKNHIVKTSLPYQIFTSQSGKNIYVGKSSRDNDYLTFKVAKGNDLWLHTMDYPGSHIVVPLNKNEEADQETLLDAALLALNYSKAKKHNEATVMYTKKKFISKLKQAKPGQVQVSEYKTVLIELDQNRLNQIKDRK